MLNKALTLRWLVVAGLIAVTVACFAGFGMVKQQFFPNSNTPLFFVYYQLPQGTSIQKTSDDLQVMEDWLLKQDDVVSVASYAGDGATRFMLTYDAGKGNPGYGHLIIRTENIDVIPALRKRLEAFGAENFPEGEFRVVRLIFGPGGGAPIQVRLSGSDPEVLRVLAGETAAVMENASDNLLNLRTDWREQELSVIPIYATNRAQSAGVSRDDIAQGLQFSTDGIRAGTYRERERLIPIITRRPADEDYSLNKQLVYSSVKGVICRSNRSRMGLNTGWKTPSSTAGTGCRPLLSGLTFRQI